MTSFTDLFIKRPVLAIVVSFVILIAGLQAMKTLNVRQYPRSDIAAITVTTVYVGADAELVRGFITTPVERAIAAADGIDYIQSQSTQSLSTITARLKLNYDANKALSDISARVDAIRNNLPPESQIPVIAIQAADSQFASAYLSFTSDILQPNEVTDYLVRLVQPRLTAVGGSDTHLLRARDPDPRHAQRLGTPTTWVAAGPHLDAGTILDALRGARTFVSATPAGPQLYLEPGGDGVRVSVRGGGGGTMSVITDAGSVGQSAVTDADEFTATFAVPRAAAYVRAQIANDRGELLALTSPLWRR